MTGATVVVVVTPATVVIVTGIVVVVTVPPQLTRPIASNTDGSHAAANFCPPDSVMWTPSRRSVPRIRLRRVRHRPDLHRRRVGHIVRAVPLVVREARHERIVEDRHVPGRLCLARTRSHEQRPEQRQHQTHDDTLTPSGSSTATPTGRASTSRPRRGPPGRPANRSNDPQGLRSKLGLVPRAEHGIPHSIERLRSPPLPDTLRNPPPESSVSALFG